MIYYYNNLIIKSNENKYESIINDFDFIIAN